MIKIDFQILLLTAYLEKCYIGDFGVGFFLCFIFNI